MHEHEGIVYKEGRGCILQYYSDTRRRLLPSPYYYTAEVFGSSDGACLDAISISLENESSSPSSSTALVAGVFVSSKMREPTKTTAADRKRMHPSTKNLLRTESPNSIETYCTPAWKHKEMNELKKRATPRFFLRVLNEIMRKKCW